MTTETKDGDKPKFDINNPETYPDDPEELASLMSQATIGDGLDPEEAAKAKAEEEAKAKADADAKAKEEADAKAKADAEKAAADAAAGKTTEGETTPTGVLTADGKKIIPYNVLAETRRREDTERNARMEAEKRAQEMTAQVEELREQLAKGGERPAGSAAKTAEIRAQVEALKADVPEVAGILDTMLSTMTTLEEELGGFREQQEARVAQERQEAQGRVQQAIDNIPALRYWQNEDADKFNEAASYDKSLRENQKFGHLTTQERFERVVSIMEGLHGPTEIPETYRDVRPPAADNAKGSADAAAKAAADAKAKQQADEKARADAAASKGGKVADRPLSLSDLPGGVPPAAGQKAIEEMTIGDIEASVGRMLDKGASVDEILSTYNRP